MATNIPITPETLITVKVTIEGINRKFKIPLRDLGITTFPEKLRSLLSLPSNQEVLFERFSDSAGTFVALDANNPQVYKQLYRAAKAKLKLRIRATVMNKEPGLCNTYPSTSADPAPSYHTIDTMANNPSTPTLTDGPHSSRWSLRSAVDVNRPTVTASTSCIDMAFARSPAARERFFAQLANVSRERELALRIKEQSIPGPPGSWSVYCNNCDHPMADAHFHCSTCDDGDYDLCEPCVQAGHTCLVEGHWLIKRFVRDGKVITSTTERVPSKIKQETKSECGNDMPGAFGVEPKADIPHPPAFTRTCNCCIKEFPEMFFVTCTSCDDYDLCIPCLTANKHGHHPGHALEAVANGAAIGTLATKLCAAGRNIRHAATCDGCDKPIYGVRNKCLVCPDFDYCVECFKSTPLIHPGHRFVPVYDPLPTPRTNYAKHFGVYCDGPLCRDKEHQSCITGVRYKCAICHDTDFCANCEAIQSNRHNRTHPLIVFKTPVDNVNVSTTNVDKFGKSRAMGDRSPPVQATPARKSASTETVSAAPSVNAATQVQTVAELQPTVEDPSHAIPEQQVGDKNEGKHVVEDKTTEPRPEIAAKTPEPELKATFVRDTVADGTKYPPDMRFVQTWTLRNPGPYSWPAGCSVRFIGGDSMLNVDDAHPSSRTDRAEATESNVIGRPVAPGEQVDFRVLLKTPKRAGKSISYWRLKTCNGIPFGHKLWCDIDVYQRPESISNESHGQPSEPKNQDRQNMRHDFRWHQMQHLDKLYQLEHQNKMRLMAARAQQMMELQASASSSATRVMPMPANLAGAEYRTQLSLIEQHKKVRQQIRQQLLARQQMDKPAERNVEARNGIELSEKLAEQMVGKAVPQERQEETVSTGLAQATLIPNEQEAAKESNSAAAAAAAEKSDIVTEAVGAPSQDGVEGKTEVVQAAQAKTDITGEVKPESEAHGSQMIFPTLDKESPTSSKYESAHAPSEASSETPSVVPARPAALEVETEEGFEDVESLDLQGSEDADDGFSTDGEWDVLDASDEEYAASASGVRQK